MVVGGREWWWEETWMFVDDAKSNVGKHSQLIFIVNSRKSMWNPHGPVHGIHLEFTIPWTFHMDSIVGME